MEGKIKKTVTRSKLSSILVRLLETLQERDGVYLHLASPLTDYVQYVHTRIKTGHLQGLTN
jgi:hypothetical protein